MTLPLYVNAILYYCLSELRRKKKYLLSALRTSSLNEQRAKGASTLCQEENCPPILCCATQVWE